MFSNYILYESSYFNEQDNALTPLSFIRPYSNHIEDHSSISLGECTPLMIAIGFLYHFKIEF